MFQWSQWQGLLGRSAALRALPLIVGVVCAAVVATAWGASGRGVSLSSSSSSSQTGANTHTDSSSSSTWSDGSGGSGGLASESRRVSGFHAVVLSGVGELSISQTGTESLRIEAEASVLPRLRSTVAGGTLTLGVRPGDSIQTHEPIRYTLTVKSLDSLDLTGAAEVTATGIATDALRVVMRGTGSVTLQGRARSLALDLLGTGTFDGENLESARARVAIGGTGHAIVRVSDSLDATVGGVGSVEYIGDPQVTEHISGLGSVSQR